MVFFWGGVVRVVYVLVNWWVCCLILVVLMFGVNSVELMLKFCVLVVIYGVMVLGVMLLIGSIGRFGGSMVC